MTSFRAAAGTGEDWLGACDDCLATLGELPREANLGFAYVSSTFAHALDHVASRLREATGIADWVGSGSSGVCAFGKTDRSDEDISVLTVSLPPDGFRFFDGLEDLPAGGRSGDAAAKLAIVHGDPRQIQLAPMVERAAGASGAFLVGGLTSATGHGGMHLAGQPTEGGLSGVLLSEKVPVITGLTQGCTPIGPVRHVTGTDGPWITTLDGRPALDSLKEDVGPMLARSLDRMTGFILAARLEGGHDQSDYLVRDLGGIDALRGFIMVGDDLRRGDPLCFVKRDPEGAKADLRRLLTDLQERAAGRPIRGALYHSCVGRGQHLFGSDKAELSLIEEELGRVPLSGFRTNGEIFRNRLYGYSAVLTLFLGEEAQ